MPGGRRMRLQGEGPEWSDVCAVLHMRLLDAAAELNVSVTYLRRICREKGLTSWPGKKVRYMNRTGKVVVPEGDALEAGSSWTSLPGNYQLAKILEDKEEEGDDMTGIHKPVVNYRRPRPPAKELTTLNLIDKIGSSSSSQNN